MKCEYKTGKMSGLDCSCEECQKIRAMILKKYKKGELWVVAIESEKKKLGIK